MRSTTIKYASTPIRDTLLIPIKSGYQLIQCEQIMLLEADSNYCHIHMHDGSKHIVCKTLKRIALHLADPMFVRVHKRFLVNLLFVTHIIKGKNMNILLANGTNVLVSRSHRVKLRECLAHSDSFTHNSISSNTGVLRPVNRFVHTAAVACILGFQLLMPLLSQAQVTIDYNSTNTSPQLILQEPADDFARINFKNTNSSTAYWSLLGKVNTVDSASRFRIFFEGISSNGAPLVITGNQRLGVGTSDPGARLTIKQAQDNDAMGFRIVNATGNATGRMWLDGSNLNIHAGSNPDNGLTFKPTGRIGAFTNSPGAKFAIYQGDYNATDDLFLVSRLKLVGNIIQTYRILDAKEDGNAYIRRLGIREDNPTHQLDVNTDNPDDNPFRVRVQDITKFRVMNNGGTSIGSGNADPPVDGMHVEGQLHVGTNGLGTDRLQVRSETDENPFRVLVDTETKFRVLSNGGTSIGTNNESAPANGLYVLGNVNLGNGSDIALRDDGGNVSILLNADHNGKGRISTDELQINGGSDISEMFTIQSSYPISPGTLVSIDPRHPGQLCVTKQAYDTKVVGVVSGANGIATGLIMGQQGTIADGSYPIALTGRVYVKADARRHAIHPGDLLTSSDIDGHAMKLHHREKGMGAIIGKALTPLHNEQGEVLVLISLQ